jgi:heptosyltransferase I
MMSALGDAVHVLPLICALKRHSPRLRVSWVLEPAASRLVSGHPLVDEVVVHRRGLAALKDLKWRMRNRHFDILLDLQVALKAGLATSVIPAERKIGFDFARARDLNWLFTNEKIPRHPHQHVQDQYFEFLRYLGVQAEPVEWMLGPWPGEEKVATPLVWDQTKQLVSLVLATSRAEKDWEASRWARLVTALHEQYKLQPVLVGGSSRKESAIAATIGRESSAPVISTLGCSLRAMVGVLSRSSLVISPDTAPLHMSVALGVPVISLMGYTNPLRVGPYRRYHELIVDAYGDPGENYKPSLEYRPGRMQRIEVSDVLDKVRLWRDSTAA